ncbi:MAG TPA: serine/threonine-protein kinase [Polyangiaceae bacterium]|nr:serine/threonine-protein kinase [Polyangiaceae bacterium]
MSKPSSDPRTVYQASSMDVPVISQTFRNYVEGDVIGGKYQLLRILGSGGMGAVWIARNRLLDIDVCLKLIRQGANELEHRDRLQREARAAARLNDPAIVRVLDFGTTDLGEPYIVMELLQGSDLRTVLMERERIPPEEAVQLILPVIRAIGTAHDAGIVHRDVKPENIFVAKTTSGALQPKLLDFGIARLDADENARLTKTGAVLGSPAYMSPEQARGEVTDYRCDLWAIVLVLHEMLTGEATFDAPNYNAALQLILGKDPAPIDRFGIHEPVLSSVLEAGLNKDAKRRFQSAAQLGRALADWLLSRGVMTDLTGLSLREGWFGRIRTPAVPEQTRASANRVRLEHSDTQLVGTAETAGARVQKRNWKLAVGIGVLVPISAIGVLLARAGLFEKTSEPTHPAGTALVSAATDQTQLVAVPSNIPPPPPEAPLQTGPEVTLAPGAAEKGARDEQPVTNAKSGHAAPAASENAAPKSAPKSNSPAPQKNGAAATTSKSATSAAPPVTPAPAPAKDDSFKDPFE